MGLSSPAKLDIKGCIAANELQSTDSCWRLILYCSGRCMSDYIHLALIPHSNGDQHRAVKYSSVSPSWPFQAKGAVIIRSQSSQEVGWGLGNVSPSSTPLFFSPFNPLSISLSSSKRAFLHTAAPEWTRQAAQCPSQRCV
ncbi:hypothetical protein R3I93_004193 [Phoxinus phoxinus]|uniref:Uncharacterized protein n=1 Tax=Phoxinus phoxinus TaxID=58324 RepID=A0AAN9DCM9_9TELE